MVARSRSRRARARSLIALCCIALMLVATNILAARFLPAAARSDGGASLYAVARHAADAAQHRRADHLALLLFGPARRGDPGLRRLRPAGARAARPVCRRRARQAAPRSASAAAVLRRSRTAPSPSGCRACRSTRRASRSISASPAPTRPTISRSIPFFAAGARAPARIRPDAGGAYPRLPEADRGRADQQPAARRRSAWRRCRASPSRRWRCSQQLRQLDDVETLPTALDAIPSGTDVLMLVQPQNLPEQDPVRDRPVRAAGRPGDRLRRSLFRAAGAPRRPPEQRRRQHSGAPVQGLGSQHAARHRGRRPPRRAPGRWCRRRPAATSRSTMSPGSICATAS